MPHSVGTASVCWRSCPAGRGRGRHASRPCASCGALESGGYGLGLAQGASFTWGASGLSWATAGYDGRHDTFTVHQDGPRKLWDEILTVYTR